MELGGRCAFLVSVALFGGFFWLFWVKTLCDVGWCEGSAVWAKIRSNVLRLSGICEFERKDRFQGLVVRFSHRNRIRFVLSTFSAI